MGVSNTDNIIQTCCESSMGTGGLFEILLMSVSPDNTRWIPRKGLYQGFLETEWRKKFVGWFMRWYTRMDFVNWKTADIIKPNNDNI